MAIELHLIDELGQTIAIARFETQRSTRWWAQQLANYLGSDVRLLWMDTDARKALKEERFCAEEDGAPW